MNRKELITEVKTLIDDADGDGLVLTESEAAYQLAIQIVSLLDDLDVVMLDAQVS